MAKKTVSLSPSPALLDALTEYRKRQERSSHPDGNFDNGGRWYPAFSEKQECCETIRSPSRAYPYSYLVHCRSIAHVAALYEVSVTDLRRLDRQQTQPTREGGDNYYKAVAIVDGRLLSIYDGSTEYNIGQQLTEPARRDHNGGYYAYRSAREAAAAMVPKSSKLLDADWVILQCRGEGTYCVYDNGKIAFSRLTPLRIVPLDRDVSLVPIAA